MFTDHRRRHLLHVCQHDRTVSDLLDRETALHAGAKALNPDGVLNRGQTLGTYTKDQIPMDELQNLMAGGKELQQLSDELGGTV